MVIVDRDMGKCGGTQESVGGQVEKGPPDWADLFTE